MQYVASLPTPTVAFSVDADGLVDYASALEGILLGTGTAKLTLVGSSIQLDTTALSRFGLYLLIPLGSWSAAALVERFIDRALG